MLLRDVSADGKGQFEYKLIKTKKMFSLTSFCNLLKFLIESIKEASRAKQNSSFFTMTKRIIKMKNEFFLVPNEILK